MAEVTALPIPRPAPAPVPLRQLLPWATFGLLLAVVALYFVGAEQSATSIFSGQWLHEVTHDGRHLLGFPCH